MGGKPYADDHGADRRDYHAAKGYPADDDALKSVVIEMVVTVLRRLCKYG